ncbi:TonB-dependent receptor plug domain-containing protein [Sphingosinithalassobacter sp. LHW66-3]|uniref:TonB-dependent receptor plug domain-containing protein n=1 Tax=Sphingosinithalassobacter sp. LHW66-3 TaxID=3424718 RepID=UPI003D6ACB0F
MITASPMALAAQEAPPASTGPAEPNPQDAAPQGEAYEAEEIVVRSELRGSVIGDIEPEQVLTPADVRSYGASSIEELLEALAPQTGSARGRGGERPVLLLNGRRISGFRELRDIPTEAIERVEILPEEVALKYGYRADQRVVNFVLRERFRSFTAELEGEVPTAGGFSAVEAEGGLLRLNSNGRFNLNVEYEGSSALLESERDIVPTTSTGFYDVVGNITAPGGVGEIDPALSAIAGIPVTVAGVPGGAAGGAPALAGFVPTANTPNANGLTPYRTLRGPSEQLSINAVVSRALSTDITATLNAELEATNGETLLGLPGAVATLPAGSPFSPFSGPVELYRYYPSLAPLTRSTDGRTAHLGLAINGDSEEWRWSVTGNYDYSTSETFTDRGVDASGLQAALDAGDPGVNPFATPPLALLDALPVDRTRSASSVGELQAQIAGAPLSLPTGDVTTSLRVGATTTDFESETLRSGIMRSSSVSRDLASGQLSVDVPIASTREAVLDFAGDITLNGNVEVEQLSDFGTLLTYGYGVNWEPVDDLRFLVSVTEEEGAPTPQQLGDPTLVTPNVSVFDYTRGETVNVTTITGGNPDLAPDDRSVFKLGVNARILEEPDLRFSADYVRSTTRNDISSLPAATAAIEAAFPERFVRDTSGRLIQVDTRAVNFARTEREQIRYGFNFSMPLTSTVQRRIERYRAAREEAERTGQPAPPVPEELQRMRQQRGERRGGAEGGGQPPRNGGEQAAGSSGQEGPPTEGARTPRGPGGGFGGRRGGRDGMGAGRINFSLYHTVHLRDEVLIREGLPVIDRLNGDATGSTGGQPRHELEFRAGIFKDGIGARISADWRSGTRVNAGTLGAPEPLDFAPFTTIDLRLFADLGQQLSLTRDHPWLRGTRVSLSLDNVFDARQRVTDRSGAVPLSYQPDLLDPVGRQVSISIRKLFF